MACGFARSVDALAAMFAEAQAAGTRKCREWTGDEAAAYTSAISQGDGEAIVTALVRRAVRSKDISLGAMLTDERIVRWLDVAIRHADVPDEDLPRLAEVMRRDDLAKADFIAASLLVSDDALSDVTALLRSPLLREVLPGLSLEVDDCLDCYVVVLCLPRPPDGWRLASLPAILRGRHGIEHILVRDQAGSTATPGPEERGWSDPDPRLPT